MNAQQSDAAATLLGLPFGWGAIIATVGAVITTIFGGGALGIWIKSRAEMKAAETARVKVDMDGEERLRSEMWKDIEALKLSKEDTSRRLTMAETKLVEQSVELGQHRFLLKLVTDELDRVSPGNPVAKQARDMIENMMRQAFPNAEEIGPMTEIMSKLCRIDPTGEC